MLFFVEKRWTPGIALAKTAGIALMTLGAVVIACPAVLALVSQLTYVGGTPEIERQPFDRNVGDS